MKRRDWLKLLSLPCGLALGSGIPRVSLAQGQLYQGKALISILAYGGIDQSSWVDPRETDGSINLWAQDKRPAGVSGRIRYAPLGGNKEFFERFHRQMLVVNGIHSETNSHVIGQRIKTAGATATAFPNLTELYAHRFGQGLPLPHLKSRYFNVKGGGTVQAPTTAPSPEAWRIMNNPNATSTNADFLKPADVSRIQASRLERLRALQSRADNLPRLNEALGQYAESLAVRGLLQGVAPVNKFDGGKEGQDELHIALLAIKAGLTASTQHVIGNFDGHADIIGNHSQNLTRLATMIGYVWDKARDLGIEQRVFLRIYTEFGRTPWINTSQGKDHWAVGSEILMEANPIWGNRVFGVSGPRHEPVLVNPRTGQPDPQNGVLVRSSNLHQAIRDYLQIGDVPPNHALKVASGERLALFDPTAHSGYPYI